MGAVGGRRDDDLVRSEAAAPVAGGVGEKLERIFVSVRMRPLSEKEVAASDHCDWECINDTTIFFRNNIPERSMPPTAYTFDRVFGPDCPTKKVYEEGAKEVAMSVVRGINSTIFAYGQTSSGKTYTMTGITEYTVGDIYDYIHRQQERAFVLKFSAIEIYNEAVRDLLSTDSTPLRLLDDPEKGTMVERLTEETLRDRYHLKALISLCEAHRKIGETSLNETSSRSHQILRLTVQSSAREFWGKDNSSTLVAIVNFVDLAGSERASQANSAGTRLKEGCHINRSLLTLGTVIRKLCNGRNGHIPYRDSKLTRILQPSLGGNARTAIICTMSPARTHFEQSRNTLLFASCAKEVETNAQVNVVMSDKALVKHLQKELARLESELRYPGLSPSVETLLKEKDDQIKKMEREMEELIQQRDIAQSRLEILFQATELDDVSRQSGESTQTSTPIVPYACEDMLSSYEPSDVVDLSPDSFLAKSIASDKGQYLQRDSKVIHLLKHPISSPTHLVLSGDLSEQDLDRNLDGDYDDLSEEVKCIEIHEVGKTANLGSPSNGTSNGFFDVNIESEGRKKKHRPEGRMRWQLLSNKTMTLEEHLQEVRKKFSNLLTDFPDDSSSVSSVQNLSASGGLLLKRSCRTSLISISSQSQEVDQNGRSSDRFVQHIHERPQNFQRKGFALNYSVETQVLEGDGSHSSRNSISSSAQQPQIPEVESEWEMNGIQDFVAELKRMSHGQFQKLLSGQETDWKADEGLGDGSAKIFYVDPTLYPMQSPYRWLQEFQKKQQEIIVLWHDCNVSLVHRTYFFILFKGDPTDSIYMEVELRRLSFQKNTLSRENLDDASAFQQSTASESSIKELRREREMLYRQMQKRLSLEDRVNLYVKWGIALESKQRRWQLARRIWSETKDLEHVKESASLVALLVGLEEQGQALKEMFGLSFTRQEPSRKFLSWRNGLSSR